MADNKSAVESFLGSLEENKNPFIKQQEDPFPHFEEKEEVIEEKEEKPLPFNKDPKVLKFIEKELNKRLENFKETREEKPATQQEDDDFYVRLIGNDTPEKVAMIKEYKAREEKLLGQAEERAFNRHSQKEQEAMKADREAEEELENAFENIEENFDVDITSNRPSAIKLQNEFRAFAIKIAPKDLNGDIVDYPDMQSAWETFSELKKSTATPSRAKELASRSMGRSGGSEQAPQQRSNRSSFESTDNFLESLGK